MKQTFLAAILVCATALGSAAQAPARKIALVIDESDPAERGLFERLAASYQGRATLARYEIDDARLSDPITKGKLLADLAASDLVVAVGDGATEFATREVEDVPVYFVDAAVVKGERLKSPTVEGLLSYNVESLLDAIKALRLDAVGIAYTPGYEPVADWIRRGAKARGIEVAARSIAKPGEVAPAVRELLERTHAIWVVGDPLLIRDAGFSFIQERSLSLDVPVIGPGRWDVEHGALLGYQSDPAEQATAAERAIDGLLSRGTPDAARLSPAASSGTILLNGTLAKKWDYAPTRGLRWRTVR